MTFAKKQIFDQSFLSKSLTQNQEVNNTSASNEDSGVVPFSSKQKKDFSIDENDMENFEKIQSINEEAALKTLLSAQDKNINEFVKKQIENAILVENIGTEMTFSISNKPEHTKNYEAFFRSIEKNMNNHEKLGDVCLQSTT